MKKIVSGLVLLGMSSMVTPTQATFGGFRVSGSAGVALLKGRHFYSGQPYPTADMTKRLNVISGLLGVQAGYLFEIPSSRFVVGAEVYYLMPMVERKIDLTLVGQPTDGNVTIKHNKSIGFALTVGMMFNPKILAYANIGMENARFQFKYDLNVPNIPKNQVSHTFKALVPTVGAAYKISSHFLIGAEVSFPFFKRFKGGTPGPKGYNYKPVEPRATLKVTYVF